MFQNYQVALRSKLTQAIMQDRGISFWQARGIVNKVERADKATVEAALGKTVSMTDGVLVGVSYASGLSPQTDAIGDGKILGAIGNAFNNAIKYLSDPNNIANIQNTITNLLKIAAIIAPIFGLKLMSMFMVKTDAAGAQVVDLDKLKAEFADLQTLQQAQADAQLAAAAASDTLAKLKSDNAVEMAALVAKQTEAESAQQAVVDAANKTLSDATDLNSKEIAYMIALLNGDANAVDPTPAPITPPTPIPPGTAG